MALRQALYRMRRDGETDFSKEDLMEAAGLDFLDRKDYQAASHYIAYMRQVLADFVTWFWQAPQYQQYIHNGLTPRAVFNKAVEAMVEHEIFPLYYEPADGLYHLLTLEGFQRILRLQQLATRSLIIRRVEELSILDPKFPQLRENLGPLPLPTDGRFVLPPPSMRSPCSHCAAVFVDDDSLREHMRRRHPEAGRLSLPPPGEGPGP